MTAGIVNLFLRSSLGLPWVTARLVLLSLGDRLERGLVLVDDVELDRACRLVGEVLVAVNGAAWNVGVVADLEGTRRLAPDGEGDFAFLHRRPLVARKC